ncbi:Mal d 1-associated protein [Trifolium repens]|nr:Mal d 1-associated protein [Trifolium repens]
MRGAFAIKTSKKPFFISSAASKKLPRPPKRLRSMTSISLRNPGKSNAPWSDELFDEPNVVDPPLSTSLVRSSSVYSLFDCNTSTGLRISQRLKMKLKFQLHLTQSESNKTAT